MLSLIEDGDRFALSVIDFSNIRTQRVPLCLGPSPAPDFTTSSVDGFCDKFP
jgi:hypothetical protein